MNNAGNDITIIAEGKHLRLVKKDHWEYVQRTTTSQVVAMIAVTRDDRLLLIEQYRTPLDRRVIELPAGLVGDVPGQRSESLSDAAARELVEETGYAAAKMTVIATGPSSAGLTNETVTLLMAEELMRTGLGGGDENEDIQVHKVPLNELPEWLTRMSAMNFAIDFKIYAAMYFLNAKKLPGHLL